jgi:hypothetical protein
MQPELGLACASLTRRKPAHSARRRPSACPWPLAAGHQ